MLYGDGWSNNEDEIEEAITDMLTDLVHLVHDYDDTETFTFDSLVQRAQKHYTAELKETS